jgi:hypothetical protein
MPHFSAEILKPRRTWTDVLHILWDQRCQARLLYSAKLSITINGENRISHNKVKFTQYVFTNRALQRLLVLQALLVPVCVEQVSGYRWTRNWRKTDKINTRGCVESECNFSSWDHTFYTEEQQETRRDTSAELQWYNTKWMYTSKEGRDQDAATRNRVRCNDSLLLSPPAGILSKCPFMLFLWA